VIWCPFAQNVVRANGASVWLREPAKASLRALGPLTGVVVRPSSGNATGGRDGGKRDGETDILVEELVDATGGDHGRAEVLRLRNVDAEHAHVDLDDLAAGHPVDLRGDLLA
jgi:hypothetical protein